ncbi:MAG: hypothetical protein WBA68_01530 [Alteraurantiacibacter sp.]
MTSETNPDAHLGDAYRYRNVRPLATFGFAALAALGALGLVAVAQGALVEATQDDVIADPPDLRKVLVAVEDRTGIDIPGTPDKAVSAEEAPVAIIVSGEH